MPTGWTMRTKTKQANGASTRCWFLTVEKHKRDKISDKRYFENKSDKRIFKIAIKMQKKKNGRLGIRTAIRFV